MIKNDLKLILALLGQSLWLFVAVELYAQEPATPCYASKCYRIQIFCPGKCTLDGWEICFDAEGKMESFDTCYGELDIFKPFDEGGMECSILDQSTGKRTYSAKFDCVKDGIRTRAKLFLKFVKCGTDDCAKISSGTFTNKAERLKCSLRGFEFSPPSEE